MRERGAVDEQPVAPADGQRGGPWEQPAEQGGEPWEQPAEQGGGPWEQPAEQGGGPWEQPAAAERHPFLFAAVLTAAAAGAVWVLATTPGDNVGFMSAGAEDASPDRNELAAGDDALAEVPEVRTGLAFLELGDTLDRASGALGPADEDAPDINASRTYFWHLDGGAELGVTADEHGILGLSAHVPADSPVRLHAYGSVALGASTPDDVVARWGDGYDVTEHDGDDFVLRYVECVGPFPVVAKFDQDTPGIAWDEPVTRFLVAFADADPGTAGCPAA